MKSRIALWIALIPIAAVLGVALIALFTSPAQPAIKLAISTVFVGDDTGHGSGVHIGSGYILTAAHVTEDKATMPIKDSLGFIQPGTVLWSNKTYDVALIRVDSYAGLATARISCHGALAIGAAVEAIGNPLNLEFVRTWGHVASNTQERLDWKLAYIADLSLAPGSSGGPVFDSAGRVVGLAVGGSVIASAILQRDGSKLPDRFSVTPYSFSYVVPASAACLLLARTTT